MKIGFPRRVEKTTIICTFELFHRPSLEFVWYRRRSNRNQAFPWHETSRGLFHSHGIMVKIFREKVTQPVTQSCSCRLKFTELPALIQDRRDICRNPFLDAPVAKDEAKEPRQGHGFIHTCLTQFGSYRVLKWYSFSVLRRALPVNGSLQRETKEAMDEITNAEWIYKKWMFQLFQGKSFKDYLCTRATRHQVNIVEREPQQHVLQIDCPAESTSIMKATLPWRPSAGWLFGIRVKDRFAEKFMAEAQEREIKFSVTTTYPKEAKLEDPSCFYAENNGIKSIPPRLILCSRLWCDLGGYDTMQNRREAT